MRVSDLPIDVYADDVVTDGVLPACRSCKTYGATAARWRDRARTLSAKLARLRQQRGEARDQHVADLERSIEHLRARRWLVEEARALLERAADVIADRPMTATARRQVQADIDAFLGRRR